MSRRLDRTQARARALANSLLLGLACGSGCATLPTEEGLPYEGTLPVGVTVTVLTPMPPNAPFAWSPSGEEVALTRDGLRVRDLKTGAERLLAPGEADALAWSPSGDRLAAAEQQGEEIRLRLLTLDGGVQAEVSLQGELDRLVWSPAGELLVGAAIRKQYSFGSNLKTVLYRWRGDGEPEALPLGELTLMGKRAHLAVGEGSLGGGPALSPLGDEVLCTVLHRPPAFAPYKALLLINLGTQVIRTIARLPPDSPGGVFSPDAERVLFRGSGYSSSGQGSSERIDPDAWAFPDAGRCLAISPSGRYLFAGGRLLRGSEHLLTFALNAEASFGPEGRRLLVRSKNQLLLVDGLSGRPALSLPIELHQDLLTLRRWRSLELISPSEYAERRQLAMAGGLAELPDPTSYTETQLQVQLIELRGEIHWDGDDDAAELPTADVPLGEAPTPRLQGFEKRLLELKAAFDGLKLGEWQYGKEKARILDELSAGR